MRRPLVTEVLRKVLWLLTWPPARARRGCSRTPSSSSSGEWSLCRCSWCCRSPAAAQGWSLRLCPRSPVNTWCNGVFTGESCSPLVAENYLSDRNSRALVTSNSSSLWVSSLLMAWMLSSWTLSLLSKNLRFRSCFAHSASSFSCSSFTGAKMMQ